jgi:UDP-GlcNAc:undecaprenyl-phosphate/decaprenyl-phosphate GlcNAc-1-phosphate transferase
VFYYFLITLFLSAVLTLSVRKIALKLNIIDHPDGDRKTHAKPTPLLGGVAIFLSFWSVILFLIFNPVYGVEKIMDQLMVALISGIIIFLIGIADDLRPFSAQIRLFFTAIAILIAVIAFPWLTKITNPFGGFIQLGEIAGSILVFFWLFGMTYTTKILDGLDGLATGVVSVGAFIILLLTSLTKFYQPNVALVSAAFLAACLGFLVFNFYPAKIFLGESGSMFIGFMLGILAIIGGGKLATALLVMAIPILDLARVAYVRIKRKQPLFKGDREHLHFRLFDSGFSHRQSVLLLYLLAFLFGITTLFLQSRQKLYALLVLVVLMAIISHYIGRRKV